MPFNANEIRTIVDIINSSIDESEFAGTLTVQPNDISPSTGTSGLIRWMNPDDNPLKGLFEKLSTDRYFNTGLFYHFKNFGRAYDIIDNKSIQVSSLLSNHQNDFAEYSEFIHRLGLIYPFIPNNFIIQKLTKTFNPAAKRPIDDDRNRILILCFVKDCHNERFWSDYANNDQGVAIGFRFENFHNPQTDLLDFRDVVYDNGYRFEFINKLNFRLLNKFGRILLVDGLTKFAKFYKRGSYSWENETRLAFHYSKGFLGLHPTLSRHFRVHFDKPHFRYYLDLPLEGNPAPNPFFTMKVDELICGRNVPAPDFARIQQLTTNNFPTARVWKRK